MQNENQDEQFMHTALQLAYEAERQGEVPVGAVLVQEGQVIGRGYNRTITDHDPSAHAEIVAMRDAGQALSNYRLPQTSLYVTLEPCSMCAGAIIHARVSRVIYAAHDPKTGAHTSQFELLQHPGHNHRVEVMHGIMADESRELLQRFFRARRKKTPN